MFQRLEPQLILMYFYDLHSLFNATLFSSVENFLAQRLSPAEYAERAQLQILAQIACIRRAVMNAPCAQKWIGSSLALHMESAELPGRDDEDYPFSAQNSLYGKSYAQLNIFDFGRSELNTVEHHPGLPAKERLDRQTFWDHYASGVDRLLWEAARLYFNRYICSDFNFIHLDFFDYDFMSCNDYLGSVTIPLDQGVPRKGLSDTWRVYDLPLVDKRGKKVTSGRGGKTSWAKIEVRCMEYPEPSKFKCGIQVRVLSAMNLPAMDSAIKAGLSRRGRSSDPFVLVSLGCAGDDAEAHGNKRFSEIAVSTSSFSSFKMAVPRPLVGGSLDHDIILNNSSGLTWTTEQGPVQEQTLNPVWGRDSVSNPPLEFATHAGQEDKRRLLLNAFQAALQLDCTLGKWQ